MREPKGRQQNDPLLLPLLSAGNDGELESLLAALIREQAEPIARSVIGYKLRVFISHSGQSRHNQDADDVYGDVVIKLLGRLRDFRAEPEERAIGNFRHYVKVVAANACAEYLRRKYPLRASLRDQLRYLLTHKPDFALWEFQAGASGSSDWMCGLADWRDQTAAPGASLRLQQLRDQPTASLKARLRWRNLPLPDFLDAIFRWMGGPVELDELVGLVAELKRIKDHVAHAAAEPATEERAEPEIKDSRIDAEAELQQRQHLRRLWAEICELPPRQRFALLMNLKDRQGRDLTSLLPLTGVCTLREMAQALELPVERLAEFFNRLPLDDAAIAAHLNLTRQQVINLRKSARERLARRLLE